MTPGEPPGVLVVLAPIAAWTVTSILYRHSHGKPILFFGVRDALYQQRSASGRSDRNWLARLGSAQNCLVVAVAHGRLIVRPWFPFTLLFLPEIYGLEWDIPVQNILGITTSRTFLREALDVEFRDDFGQIQHVFLYLRDPDRLTAALEEAGGHPGSR